MIAQRTDWDSEGVERWIRASEGRRGRTVIVRLWETLLSWVYCSDSAFVLHVSGYAMRQRQRLLEKSLHTGLTI